MPQDGSARLGHSASDPGLGSSRNAGASLRTAGMGMAGMDPGTTNLYDKMKAEGRFSDFAPRIRAAGRSTVVPLDDSAGKDVQPEIFFAAPPTPIKERRFRRSHMPGEIHVHHSLKDQKLPGEEFRYGVRGVKGSSTEICMKAGQKFGIEAYKQSVKERVYESNKKEPLGKPHIRDYKNVKMLPEGFGNPSGEPENCKMVVFPVDQPVKESEDVREQYKKSHNHFEPGERVERKYNWPEAVHDHFFRFGVAAQHGQEGAGVKLALDVMKEDDGKFKQTKLVQKVCEDYRNTVHPKFARKVHYMQGAQAPPMHPDWAFGIKSVTSDCTARSCIMGYYSLDEQLPDQDLGRCTKVGRRNLTEHTRAFGTPSIRTDLEAPPGRRSVADFTNYGDECGAAALLNPQRFDNKGVPDREFLVRRPKEELEELVNASGYCLQEAAMDYEEIWDEALQLFDDDRELVSLDAFLYIFTQRVDKRVHAQHAGPGVPMAQPATV